jgi:heat shock protein HslJ
VLGVIGDAAMTADRSRRAARAGVLLVALAAATLTACGDDGPDAASTGSEPSATSGAGAPTTSTPGTTTPVTSAGTSAAGTGDEGGDISATDLDGRTFVATESTGHELVEDADVVIEFADGSVSGTGGCNSFVATPYSVDGGVLVVEGPMGMTQMACAPAALMDQDAWLAALLTGRPAIELDGDTLTLTGDGDDGLVLRAAG